MDGFAVWRVATGVGNVIPLREVGECLECRRLGVMGSDAANKEVPENHRGENRQQEKPCNVDMVFHVVSPFYYRGITMPPT